MKRGKDEDKFMVPMFPRLHVNDTDKGGPRAPPRNKMALYEQLSVPSQRFSNGMLPFSPANTSNLEPAASSSQGTGNERRRFLTDQLPPGHQAEKSYSHYSNFSMTLMQKKKLDEDDFTVPIFTDSHSDQEHGKRLGGLNTEKFTPSDCAGSNNSLKFQKACGKEPKQTSMGMHNMNQDCKSLKQVNVGASVSSLEQLDKAVSNISSRNETECLQKIIDGSQSVEPRANCGNSMDTIQKGESRIFPELCAESQPSGSVQSNAITVEPSLGINKRNSSSFRDFPVEQQNIVHDMSGDMTSHEDSSCRSPQMGNMDRADSVSETSMVDSVSGLDISPDGIVGMIGQKQFWKARRAIANQQRVFAVQVFELHRLIKVQRLIAASPHLLFEDSTYLEKPVKVSPAKKLPSDYIAKAPQNISKRKMNSEKPNPEIECSAENTTGKSPLSSVQNGSQPSPAMPFSGNPPPSPAASSDLNAGLWYFNQPVGHQWLIPVMSPADGLVYKPYPGPGFTGPACGPSGFPPWTSNFSTPVYGVPALSHQYQVPSFPPAGPQGYFPTYGMHFANPAFSGSSVEQTNQFNLQHQNSCNTPNQMPGQNKAVPDVTKPHAARNNDQQTSTASSHTERSQINPEGNAAEGRNVLSLFPTSPAVNVPDCSLSSPEPECPARVIKVVPRNARSATESAARIFQSIQEERKQYE